MLSFRVVSAVALALTGLFSVPPAAQTLSAADILAKVEEKVAGVNEYQALLNDPDPARSMAAMEVMLESGDPKLVRMALDFGIYSPNPLVQFTALKAFFDGKPLLRISIDGSDVKDQDNFFSRMRDLNGTVDANKIGYSIHKIGDFDKENSCYEQVGRGACFVRLTETEVSVNPWYNNWVRFDLNDQGVLIGEVGFEPPASASIPIAN
jgi:hypothetical protein